MVVVVPQVQAPGSWLPLKFPYQKGSQRHLLQRCSGVCWACEILQEKKGLVHERQTAARPGTVSCSPGRWRLAPCFHQCSHSRPMTGWMSRVSRCGPGLRNCCGPAAVYSVQRRLDSRISPPLQQLDQTAVVDGKHDHANDHRRKTCCGTLRGSQPLSSQEKSGC